MRARRTKGYAADLSWAWSRIHGCRQRIFQAYIILLTVASLICSSGSGSGNGSNCGQTHWQWLLMLAMNLNSYNSLSAIVRTPSLPIATPAPPTRSNCLHVTFYVSLVFLPRLLSPPQCHHFKNYYYAPQIKIVACNNRQLILHFMRRVRHLHAASVRRCCFQQQYDDDRRTSCTPN